MMSDFELSPFQAAAILIVLSATLGWFNHRFFKLPGTVAMTLMVVPRHWHPAGYRTLEQRAGNDFAKVGSGGTPGDAAEIGFAWSW
jgi:hypothetical protein